MTMVRMDLNMMNNLINAVVVLISLCNSVMGNNDSASSSLTETDLHKRLFNDYNPNIMPKLDITRPIVVGIEMYMMSIDDIDEKRQTITIRAFLAVTWKDEFLKWDPAEFSNVSRINVKVANIWVPDLALEHTFDKPTELGQEGGKANINYEGNVVMWPYSTYTVACKIQISNFPFDKQICRYQFLSWTNPASILMLNNSSGRIDLSQYKESGEWNLLNNRVYNIRKPYETDYWDLMIFELRLERKSLYQIMNIMIPVICISVLDIFCFLLPSEGGERNTLSISIFLTLAVFLTIVNSSMPESSDEIAKFGVFVGLQLLGSALTIIVTTISLYIFYRSDDISIARPYKWLVEIACISKPKYAATGGKNPNEGPRAMETAFSNEVANENGNNSNPIKQIGGDSTMNLVEVNTGVSGNGAYEELIDWKMVSRAIDRFCLVSAVVWHVGLIVVLIGTLS